MPIAAASNAPRKRCSLSRSANSARRSRRGCADRLDADDHVVAVDERRRHLHRNPPAVAVEDDRLEPRLALLPAQLALELYAADLGVFRCDQDGDVLTFELGGRVPVSFSAAAFIAMIRQSRLSRKMASVADSNRSR